MVPHQELLINGFFMGGPCDSSVPKQVVKSPWDGSVVGVAAEAMWPQADSAIDAATKSFTKWSRTSRSERAALLAVVAARLRGDTEALAQLMSLEIGKPIQMGRAELERAAITFDLAAKLMEEQEWHSIDVSSDSRSDGVVVTARKEPIGPIFCITPYNWPFNLAAHKLAPALAAGNTVVVKGSGSASLCTLALGRLMHECGFPEGVLNFLNCEPEIAEKIALDDRIKMVSFTGSPAVGWRLKELCWRKRVSLELGGTATTYVDSGVNLAVVADKLAKSAFGYAGQICISAQNVYVAFDAYDEFRNALVAATENVPTGDPSLEETWCGPMINSEAVDRVQSWIAESGGTVIAGGSRENNMLMPTLLETPLPNSQVVKEEVFGPVLTVQRVDVPSLAIVEMSRSSYGIHHSIFSENEDLIEKFCKFVPSGGWIINDVPSLRFDAMPYGGVKESGFGREGVRYAFDEMTEWSTRVRRGAP